MVSIKIRFAIVDYPLSSLSINACVDIFQQPISAICHRYNGTLTISVPKHLKSQFVDHPSAPNSNAISTDSLRFCVIRQLFLRTSSGYVHNMLIFVSATQCY